MNLVIDPRPNKYFQISSVLNNALNEYQQQQVIDQKVRESQDQGSRAQAMMFLQQFAALPADQRMAAIASAPDAVKPYLLNYSSLPAHTPTDAETAQGNYEKYVAGASSDFNAPLQADPAKLALFNKNAAEKPFMDYQGQRFNYANASSLPPQVGTAQQMGDKIVPTGQEAWTNANVTLPKANAEIAREKSTQIKNNAETAKLGEETRGIKATNDAFSSAMGPSAAPAASSGADLSKAPPLVQQLINRQYDPMLMRRWKPEQQMAIAAEVQKYDPTFSMADYQSQVAAKKAFTSGQQSQTIQSANTLIGHIGTLNEAYSKIGNGRFPMVNAMGNAIGAAGGSENTQAALGAFNTAADAVATEAARLYKGTGSTAEREIAEWRKNASPNDPPAKFKASIETMVHLLSSRLQNLDEAYKQGVGRPRDVTFLRGRSAQILKGLGIDPSEVDAGSMTPSAERDITTTPDGMRWKKNPDGSMTQVP